MRHLQGQLARSILDGNGLIVLLWIAAAMIGPTPRVRNVVLMQMSPTKKLEHLMRRCGQIRA